MKKEPLSIMIVKTLLAVIIFAGVGTIIIGGGLLIGKQETGVQDSAEEVQQRAINLIKSQKLFSDMEIYESIRSSDLFREELRDKILTEIEKDPNLSSAYQNNKEESDKIIKIIVNLKTAVSFLAETLDNGNVKVNVFLGPGSTEMEKYSQDNNKTQAYYIVDPVQNKIVEQNVNMGIPSSNLTKEEIMNQIYRDYIPVIFEFLQTKKQAEDGKSAILYFYFPGCPYCKDTEDFLDVLELKYKKIAIKKINIKESNKNMELANFYALSLMGEEKLLGVPFIVMGNEYILGWGENKQEELESYVILTLIENEIVDWQTYSNPQDSFTFEYPDGWEIAENYFYETVAGIRAKNPTVVLQEIGNDDSNNRIVINQRQFDCELGKCAEVDYITIGTYSKNSEVLSIFNRIAESFSFPRSNS